MYNMREAFVLPSRSTGQNRLSRSDLRCSVDRNGNHVSNPISFQVTTMETKEEHIARVISIMNQVYTTSPVSRQPLVAKEFAIENEALSPAMLYEAAYSGHVGVQRGIEESGKVSFISGFNFDEAIYSYREMKEKEVFDAVPEDRPALIQNLLTEFSSPGEATQILMNAAVKGFPDVVQRLIESGTPLTTDFDLTALPLHAACFNGHLECARLLVTAGLPIDHLDPETGGTPLMRASVGGRAEIVRWLIEMGADVTLRETQERGAYDALVFGTGRSTEVVQILLEAGADASRDAIKAAAHHGDEAAFDLLLSKAGFPDPIGTVIVGDKGETTSMEELDELDTDALLEALSLCGPGGSVRIAQRLVKLLCHPSDPDSVDTKQASKIKHSLQVAIQGPVVWNGHDHLANDHAALLDYLLSVYQILPESSESSERKLDTDILGPTLQHAAEKNSVACARLLLGKYKIPTDHLSLDNPAASLYHAARMGHLDTIRLLVTEYGADIHQAGGKFVNGPTAIWMAVNGQREDAVRLLLELGGGPVEEGPERLFNDHDAGQDGDNDTNRIWIAAARSYRAPVIVRTNMDPNWDLEDQSSEVRFICLEYPDGRLPKLVKRNPDRILIEMDRFGRPARSA